MSERTDKFLALLLLLGVIAFVIAAFLQMRGSTYTYENQDPVPVYDDPPNALR